MIISVFWQFSRFLWICDRWIPQKSFFFSWKNRKFEKIRIFYMVSKNFPADQIFRTFTHTINTLSEKSPTLPQFPQKSRFFNFRVAPGSEKSLFRPKIMKNRSVLFFYMVWRKFPEGRFFALLSGVEALGIRVLPPKHDFRFSKVARTFPAKK